MILRITKLINKVKKAEVDSFKYYCSEKVVNTLHKELFTLLNQCNEAHLSVHKITKSQFSNLQEWIDLNGSIKSFNDILDVKGWNPKTVQRIMKSIDESSSGPGKTTKTKSQRQFISPNLDFAKLIKISTPIALHLSTSGISWAQINRTENVLTNWNYYLFPSPPKKMLPIDTYYLTCEILERIPSGDIYIFEAPANMNPQSNKSATVIATYNQYLELTSMLLALINTSVKHNLDYERDKASNKVYYLRSKLSARLFGTLLGSERVASTTVVSNILQSDNVADIPCLPVDIDKGLKDTYFNHNPLQREMLGQVLLLALTFMNVCLHQNPSSLSVINSKKKAGQVFTQ